MTAAPTPFHVGTVVGDLDEAIALFEAFGVRSWARSAWKVGAYLDGVEGRVVEARSRVAFGRLTPDMALELIEPDPAGPMPTAWRRDGSWPSAHVGYWADDPHGHAETVVRAGGRLLLARADTTSPLPEGAGDRDWLPDELDTCYLSTLTGLIVEFVPPAVWSDRLPTLLGEHVAKAVPSPPVAPD